MQGKGSQAPSSKGENGKAVSSRSIRVTVNGKQYRAVVEARLTLADFLRENLGLTGTHLGCEHGICGACSVLLDGEVVRSCILYAIQVDGHELTTVEGLSESGELTPLQQAFWERFALQCGFCTPGFLLTAVDLLRRNPCPSESEIRENLSGNLCRCTGYANIIAAVQDASNRLSSQNEDASPD